MPTSWLCRHQWRGARGSMRTRGQVGITDSIAPRVRLHAAGGAVTLQLLLRGRKQVREKHPAMRSRFVHSDRLRRDGRDAREQAKAAARRTTFTGVVEVASRMEGESSRVATAFPQMRERGGAGRAPADICASSQAGARDAASETPRLRQRGSHEVPVLASRPKAGRCPWATWGQRFRDGLYATASAESGSAWHAKARRPSSY
jgi:hypothetical protein